VLCATNDTLGSKPSTPELLDQSLNDIKRDIAAAFTLAIVISVIS
jgi:hypothetical protein